MAETVEGGIYKGTDGNYHDANGNPVDAAKVKQARKVNADQADERKAALWAAEEAKRQAQLPADFPAREALIAAGLDTPDKVRQASDEDLAKGTGVKAATLKQIRAALGELNMATYGDTAGVEALLPAMDGLGDESTPSLSQVQIWLAEGYSIIHQYLSAAGYGVPVAVSAEVYPSLTALNNLYAAAYALRALGLDVVQGEDENRSEILLKDFFNRLKMMAGQDLTALGLSFRTSPTIQRRRVRTLQLRRVDGYSHTYGSVNEVSE